MFRTLNEKWVSPTRCHETGADGNADPPDLAARSGRVHTEEAPHALGRGVGDADERTAKHIPVEPDGLVEIRDRQADVTERAGSHLASYGPDGGKGWRLGAGGWRLPPGTTGPMPLSVSWLEPDMPQPPAASLK